MGTKTVRKPMRLLRFEGEFALPANMTHKAFVYTLYTMGIQFQGLMLDRGIKTIEIDVDDKEDGDGASS